MNSRTFHILLGVLVLALALLACNIPGENGAVPAATEPAAQDAVPTATDEGACPAVTLMPNPSGLIAGVTLAEDTTGDNREPVNPTDTYAPEATFHAVVALVEAPANTTLKAIWYAVDTGGVAECNTQIDAYELNTDGTRNVDFSLTPESVWPLGSYRIEIYTNNVLDQTFTFSVK